MAYHNLEHTDGVLRRAREIAKAMGLDQHQRWLVEIAAVFHDTVQEWDRVGSWGRIIRQRRTGGNERKSADEAILWMERQRGLFAQEDHDIVREAILVTIPTFDAARGTVVQNSLKPDSHPVVRAVALADIGSWGMDPEVFSAEGNSLFLEQEIGMVAAIRASKHPNDISQEVKAKYLERYRAWMSSQVVFAKGRAALLELELGNIDEESKIRVRQLFSHLQESLSFAESHARYAETCTFEQMARRLIPQAFAGEA